MHALALGTVAVFAAHAAASAEPSSPEAASPTDYGFASELGSGIYNIAGRTIQVYQIPLGFEMRPPLLGQNPPGINLLVPFTFGFFNFQPTQLLQLRVPSRIGAVSVEPGIELDYWLSDTWHLYPYAKVGTSFATSIDVNALIYGFGLRSDYQFYELGGEGLWRALLSYAGVNYLTSVPNDSFTRLRDGAELRHDTGFSIHGREVQVDPYGVVDLYFKPPSGPVTVISKQAVQVQVGFTVGVSPMWQVLGVTLPRIGVGYQLAGALSGWRLVIGDPF